MPVHHSHRVEGEILHRKALAGPNHPWLHLGIVDGYVSQEDVSIDASFGGMALCTGHAGPQQGARVALPEVSRVGLLSRPDPNCPLLRLLHVNILISNVLNDGHLILVHVPKLHVDAFISAIHVNIPKGDVRHHILAALRANREAKAAGLNILEQHVAGAACKSQKTAWQQGSQKNQLTALQSFAWKGSTLSNLLQ